jgi:magnesium transporter
LPINFLASVYGMNFEFMPELKMRYGYFVVVGVFILVDLSIFLCARKKGWLRL